MKSTKTQEILNYVRENANETVNGLNLFFFTEENHFYVQDLGYVVGVADAREDMENSENPLTTDLDAFMLITYQGEDYDQEYVRLSHLLGGSFPIWKIVMNIYDMLFKNDMYALTYIYEGAEDFLPYAVTLAVSSDKEKLVQKMYEYVEDDCLEPFNEDEQYDTDSNYQICERIEGVSIRLQHRVHTELYAMYTIKKVEVL